MLFTSSAVWLGTSRNPSRNRTLWLENFGKRTITSQSQSRCSSLTHWLAKRMLKYRSVICPCKGFIHVYNTVQENLKNAHTCAQTLVMFCPLLLQALKEELDREKERAEKENKVREMETLFKINVYSRCLQEGKPLGWLLTCSGYSKRLHSLLKYQGVVM